MQELDEILHEHFKDKPHYPMRVRINHAAKRTLDIAVSGTALVLLSPLMLFTGLATLYDDGRPMFFKQERIGYRGEHIIVRKFRIMHKGSEERIRKGEVQSINRYIVLPSDSEVYTKLGRFLDRTHINEFPQFWNVLKGEMSLVGNRPLPLYVVGSMINDPGFAKRFSSPPGLTGYIQLAKLEKVQAGDKNSLK